MSAPRYERPDHARAVKARLLDVRQLCMALGLVEGYRPLPQPRGLSIRCPAHGDRTPSCSVTLGDDDTIRVKCFGCDFTGDVFTLVAAARGLDLRREFPRVLEEAAYLAGYDLGADRPPSPDGAARLVDRPRASPPLLEPPRLDAAAFGAVASALLELCPLQGSVGCGLVFRGLLYEARRDAWGELPADDDEAKVVAATLRDRFGEAATSWLVAGDGFRHPEHRLVIPWRAPGGQVNELQRRYAPRFGTEDPSDEAGRRTPKYVGVAASVHRPAARYPYGAEQPDAASPETVLWIVEGAADVLALRALNRNADRPRPIAALGIPGVERWGQYRAEALAHVKGRSVRVALDDDRAGERKVDAIVADAYAAGATDVARPRPPGGAKDWAEVSASVLWKNESHDARLRRLTREQSL